MKESSAGTPPSNTRHAENLSEQILSYQICLTEVQMVGMSGSVRHFGTDAICEAKITYDFQGNLISCDDRPRISDNFQGKVLMWILSQRCHSVLHLDKLQRQLCSHFGSINLCAGGGGGFFFSALALIKTRQRNCLRPEWDSILTARSTPHRIDKLTSSEPAEASHYHRAGVNFFLSISWFY